MRAAELLGPDGPLARALARYEHRPAQLEMADAVERALERESVLLVEAGTGTGKTLAYLVPALLSGKKIVVSTGTRNLQDQIMEHDVPMLAAHLGVPVDVACLKGLGNYLCLRRYEELRVSPDAASGPVARALRVVQEWRERTATGDRAELDKLPEDAPIWGSVTSGSDTRIGPRCAHFDACFVTRAWREAEAARVVGVTHHLFFADLAMRGAHGAGALPDYDAVIFDEAHQIEDIATDFFGVRVSSARLEKLLRDADRALGAAGLREEAGAIVRQAGESAMQFFASVPRGGAGDAGRAPLTREAFSGHLLTRMHALDSSLDLLATFCKSRVTKGEAVAQMARRAQEVRDDVVTIAEGGGQGGRITWAETRGRSVSIGASPVDVSALLREHVFYRARGVVLTSATLSTAGSFDFVKRRLGVDFEVEEKVLESPFDFATQAALYLPQDLPDPRDAAYLDAATKQILALVAITGGGAFVLCTSYRVMNELASRAGASLEVPVLVQGDTPKAELLARFREAEHAVLFATSSFWEGVDVPGSALRLVIIDKLPFDVPNDPLIVARCDRMRAASEEPFMKYLVPSAALALKQGFGRLVRTRSDHGIVAVLDRRLTTKGYGKVFLRSLPPARRCSTLDEVKAFWSESRPREPASEGETVDRQ